MFQSCRTIWPFVVALCLATIGLRAKADDGTYFEKKIRPLLEEHCVECHSSDEPESGLDLSSIQGIARGGKLGPIINSKQPNTSRLLSAVQYTSKIKMPPSGKLEKGALDVFEKWLAKGAKLPQFHQVRKSGRGISESDLNWWSFQPIQRPALPPVRRADLAKSPIDYFVLAKLEQAGLKPSKQADRTTLIRRLSYNLLGLPPTEEDIKAFVSDSRPDAYERLVDRFLASPRYGERWGRHWLDAVRYADTNGGGFDYVYPQAWRYRDYVIRSFNNDTPYSRFLHEQLAGDLIWKPNENDGSTVFDPLLATGFLTLAPKGLGMQDKLQMQLDVVDDQIDVIGRSLMGVTLACARCHDHKFDPIPTHDYYALAGILFSTVSLKDTDKNPSYWPERALELPSITRARNIHAKQLAANKTALQKLRQTGTDQLIAKAKAGALDYVEAAIRIYHSKDALGLAAHFGFDQLENGVFHESRGLTAQLANIKKKPQTLPSQVDSRFGRGVRFKGAGDILDVDAKSLGDFNFGKTEDFSVSFWLRLPKGYSPNTADSVISANYAKALWFIALRPGSYNGIYLRHYDGKRAVDIKPKNNILPVLTDGKWHQIVVTSDRDRSGAVFLDGKQVGDVSISNVSQTADYNGLTKFQLGPSTNGFKGEIDDLAIWNRSLPQDFVTELFTLGSDSKPKGVADWKQQQLAMKTAAQSSGLFYSFEQANADGLTNPFLRRIVNQLSSQKKSNTHVKSLLGTRFDSVAALRDYLEQKGKEAIQSVAGPKTKVFSTAPGLYQFYSQEIKSQLTPLITEQQKLSKRTFPKPIKAMVAADNGSPKDLAIHIAGSHMNQGPVAKRGFPQVVSKSMKTTSAKIDGSGRLQFAQWLTDRSNPLTARVIANRVWQHHFGVGIVRTPDNFGRLGDKPSHPQLLDWLASELIDSSWSLKRLHKTILLSSTYRQSSRRNNAAHAVDSSNRLLWRMNRRRLEAEPIRDAMLSLSDSLDLKIGGSVNSWKDKDFSVDDANNETANYTSNQRSIYLPIVRGASVHEMLRLFDFGDPNSIVAQRTATTVATQALFLMNDPFVLKQSELIAKRVLAHTETIDERIQSAYYFAFGRSATASEIQRARVFLGRGQVDDWRDFCHSLLCMNEFIYVN